MIGFPRLAGPMLAEYAAETGMQAVAMDTAMDPAWAARNVPAHVALQGNLDPEAVVAGGAGMLAEADALRAALRGRPWIFNLGHGVEQATPPEHVAALVAHFRG